jgi:hypothetical protein
MRSRLVTCLALAGLGCSTPAIEHGKRIAHGPLQDVILLPLTTRTSEGLLGHVLREDGITPDRSRTIFRGPPRMSETEQRVTVVRELGREARVAAEYGPLRAELSESTVTHLLRAGAVACRVAGRGGRDRAERNHALVCRSALPCPPQLDRRCRGAADHSGR